MVDTRRPLLTIGHGASDGAELLARLQDADVEVLVDVRRFPGSRRNPEVGRDALEPVLPQRGIEYVWDERLGGRRRKDPGAEDADGWWRVEQFRAYASHTRTDEFRVAMTELLALAARQTVAIMCSENVWWRCHRRLVSDVAVLVHDVPVLHVMRDGRTSPHQPSEGAVLSGGGLTYPAPPDESQS